MSLPVPDRAETLAGADLYTRRLAAAIRSAPDPSAMAIGHWTVLDLTRHLSHVYSLMLGYLEGKGSPIDDHRNMAARWDAMVNQDPVTDMRELALSIESSWNAARPAFDHHGWEELHLWHGGIKVRTYTLGTIVLAEALLHGLDLSRAAGASWPMSKDHARLVFLGLLPTLPDFVDERGARGLDAVYDLRVRGAPPVHAIVKDGAVSFAEPKPGARADCHISADPLTYLLVGYGRMNQLLAIAKGGVVAWGRKPWLGPRFGKLFISP